jgi:hypothetical protein
MVGRVQVIGAGLVRDAHCSIELRVVGCLDAEANRKALAPLADEADLGVKPDCVDLLRRTQVHLHPAGCVGRIGEWRIIARAGWQRYPVFVGAGSHLRLSFQAARNATGKHSIYEFASIHPNTSSGANMLQLSGT